jgi:hypothetical protein
MAGVPPAKAGFVGDLLIASDGHGFRVKVDRIVWDKKAVLGSRSLLAFSASGGSTEVRAVRAALGVNHKVTFSFNKAVEGGRSSTIQLSADEEGYDTTARSIGMRNYHLVAVCRRPGFMPAATPEALWDYLRKETTTPIDRRWLDAIANQLLKDDRLSRPFHEGEADAGLVSVDDDYMDKCVKDLLKRGLIRIEA